MVAGGEPLAYHHLGASETYPDLPSQIDPMELAFGARDDTRKIQAVMGYASRIFPGESFWPLSTSGSSCTVLTNHKGMAFKVFDNANQYPYVEGQAAATEKLHRLGLGPRLYALVDAAEQFRTSGGMPPTSFADVAIPRINTNGPAPIIVMEQVDTRTSLQHIPPRKLLDEFDRIWPIVLKEGLVLEDVEPYYDRRSHSVKFIDVGPASQFSAAERRYIYNGAQAIDRYPDMTDQQLQGFECLRNLVGAFSGVYGGDERALYRVYKTEGLPGVHAIVEERVAQAKKQQRALHVGSFVGISKWLTRPRTSSSALYKSAHSGRGWRSRS